MSNTPQNTKALCFFDYEFSKKYNAFFSLLDTRHIDLCEFEKNFSIQLPEEFSSIYVYETLTSTLDKAHYLVEQKVFSPFTSVICHKQTAGRGQLRRKWESLTENLYVAIALPNSYPFNTEAAAPAFGAIVAQALDNLGLKVALKWPNDLVQSKNNSYQKVGGILLEERNDVLIAGMGINLFSSPSDMELREDFFISAGQLANFNEKNMINLFNQVAYNIFLDDKNNSQNNINNIDILCNENNRFITILGFWLALVKEIKLCYENRIKSKDPLVWLSICKKYLAFLGDNVLIKQALTKNNFQNEDCCENIYGQIVSIGEEGQLVLSSESGLIEIIGGSITKG